MALWPSGASRFALPESIVGSRQRYLSARDGSRIRGLVDSASLMGRRSTPGLVGIFVLGPAKERGAAASGLQRRASAMATGALGERRRVPGAVAVVFAFHLGPGEVDCAVVTGRQPYGKSDWSISRGFLLMAADSSRFERHGGRNRTRPLCCNVHVLRPVVSKRRVVPRHRDRASDDCGFQLRACRSRTMSSAHCTGSTLA